MGIPENIQNGVFGQTGPIVNTNVGYNPYDNTSLIMGNPYQQPMQMQSNIIPIGTTNYNSTGFNPYANNAQPQQNNGFVFQPVGGYQQQPQQSYYNPYPYYNTSYNGYANYSPFMSMQKQQEMMAQEIQKQKLKMKIVCAGSGTEYNEEFAEKLFNPHCTANTKTQAQIDADLEWAQVTRIVDAIPNQDSYMYPEKACAMFINERDRIYHEAYDNRSLFQFFELDYPALAREEWIAKNIKKNQTRNLSTTYNSKEYNELLNFHSSSNPYINQLLDTARYDNNISDMEVGLAEIFDREKRRRNLLEGKLPTYISSPEVQKARADFTRELMDQVYKKGAMNSV